MSKTKKSWLLEVALLPFLVMGLTLASFMAFGHLMGCGWSGSCAEFGFEIAVILLVATFVSLGRWLYSLVKFFTHPGADKPQEADH